MSYVLLSGGVCAKGDAPASELASGLRLGNCGASQKTALGWEAVVLEGLQDCAWNLVCPRALRIWRKTVFICCLAGGSSRYFPDLHRDGEASLL